MFNLNFHEVFSVISDMNSVLCMVFNSVTDELITGGTGGIKVLFFEYICLTLCLLPRCDYMQKKRIRKKRSGIRTWVSGRIRNSYILGSRLQWLIRNPGR